MQAIQIYSAPPNCRACGVFNVPDKSVILNGFLEGSAYECITCAHCGSMQTSIGDSTQLSDIYNAIYKNSDVISGYKRYSLYGDLTANRFLSAFFDIKYAERIYYGAFFFIKSQSEKLNKKLKILEVGSGLGYTTARLRQLGHDVIGSDLSNDACVRARELHGGEFLCGTSEFVRKIHGQTFDAVICLEVIEHLEAPLEMLSDLKLLLNKEGCMIFSTPNCKGKNTWDTTEPPVHVTYFTVSGVQELVKKINGFGEVINFITLRKQMAINNDIELPGKVFLRDYNPNRKYFDYGEISFRERINVLVRNFINRFYYKLFFIKNIISFEESGIKSTSIIVKVHFNTENTL